MRFRFSLALLGALLVPAAVHAANLGLMRLSYTEGAVQILFQNSADWADARVNLPLGEGDRLWVPDGSRAEIRVRGSVVVRADGGTVLDVLSADDDAVQFSIDRGHAYVNNRRDGIKTVQIDTPLASVRSYDDSTLLVDVSEDGMTEVSVLTGAVTAEGSAGAVRVAAGSVLTVRGDREAEIAPLGAPDDWEQWNTERDRMFAAGGESVRYLPDALQDYAGDFDNHGRWEYASDYGYVWVPTAVPPDWSPYSTGQWVWIRGSYVWVDADPWCWAPCHYGRWIFIASRGWCWVPPAAGAVYWGPGYVGWMITPDYVAWVPLAPGEIYYGYGYYGPWSVNITTVDYRAVAEKRTYVNARHGHAVTAATRRSFGTGRRIRPSLRGNPFLEVTRKHDRNIMIVPPQTGPHRPAVAAPPPGRDAHEPERRPPAGQVREHRQEGGAQGRSPEPAVQRQNRLLTPPSGQVRKRQQNQGVQIPAPRSSVQPQPERRPPPERLRSIRPSDGKNTRPLVRERNASVFRSRPPENLPVKRSNEPRVINRKPAKQHSPARQEDRKRGGKGEQERR